MIIPYQQLSEAALRGVIEEFVTRSFEEFGAHETTLSEKISQVERQLVSGKAVVVYDEESESVSITTPEALRG